MIIAILTTARQRQIDALNADTDRAVEDHASHASRLQSRLDMLDAELLRNVISGESTPLEAIEQRRMVLAELNAINEQLSQTCERNQRAIDLLNSHTHCPPV